MAHNYSVPHVDSAIEKVKRHPKYYLQGGDVIFLVESYLFRVHRYFFERESTWFREKLGVPAPAGQSPKGSSDANPYPLDDVLEKDFSRFLWVFYNPKYSIYDANVDDWSAILKLSYDWSFTEVKRLACRELEKFEIAPLQKIELYQSYEVDRRLLIPSYIAMCARTEPLSISEGRRLGLETSLMLATAREMARGVQTDAGPRSPLTVKVEDEAMSNIIRDVFGLSPGMPVSPYLTPIGTSGPAAFMASPTTSPTRSTRMTAAAANATLMPKFPGQYPTFSSTSAAASTTAVHSAMSDVFSSGTSTPAAPPTSTPAPASTTLGGIAPAGKPTGAPASGTTTTVNAVGSAAGASTGQSSPSFLPSSVGNRLMSLFKSQEKEVVEDQVQPKPQQAAPRTQQTRPKIQVPTSLGTKPSEVSTPVSRTPARATHSPQLQSPQVPLSPPLKTPEPLSKKAKKALAKAARKAEKEISEAMRAEEIPTTSVQVVLPQGEEEQGEEQPQTSRREVGDPQGTDASTGTSDIHSVSHTKAQSITTSSTPASIAESVQTGVDAARENADLVDKAEEATGGSSDGADQAKLPQASSADTVQNTDGEPTNSSSANTLADAETGKEEPVTNENAPAGKNDPEGQAVLSDPSDSAASAGAGSELPKEPSSSDVTEDATAPPVIGLADHSEPAAAAASEDSVQSGPGAPNAAGPSEGKDVAENENGEGQMAPEQSPGDQDGAQQVAEGGKEAKPEKVTNAADGEGQASVVGQQGASTLTSVENDPDSNWDF